MSTDLRSTTQDVSLTRFWGGQMRGSCVQVTQPRSKSLGPVTTADKFFTSVQLTRGQARRLAADLLEFAEQIGRAHVRTPVTEKPRMPSSA